MLAEEHIQEALDRYEREYDRYAKLAARVADICRAEIVEANALRAQVTFRAKSPRSFEGKLRRKRDQFASVDEVFSRLADLAAARVATYEKDDEERVVRELRKRFAGPQGAAEASGERKDKHEFDPTNFYRATHLDVVLPERDLIGVYGNLRGTVCEVQVCSMMAHVWNEIEHDLGYKPTTGSLSYAEYELLSTLGHLTRAGDGVITQLLSATDARLREATGEFEDVHDFVARMRKRFPGVSFALHAGQLFDELVALGITSPTKLDEIVGEAPTIDAFIEGQTQTTKERSRAFLGWLQQQGETRYDLDEDSSDLLLLQVLDGKADAIVAMHPVGRGLGGPNRVAWIAKRYLTYLESHRGIARHAG